MIFEVVGHPEIDSFEMSGENRVFKIAGEANADIKTTQKNSTSKIRYTEEIGWCISNSKIDKKNNFCGAFVTLKDLDKEDKFKL